MSDCLMTLQSKTDIRFSAFLCNICRLEKNTSFLHDIIQTVETQPNIIAISESEIRNSIQIYFINTNSKTRAGGVGLHLSSELEFTRRRKQLKCYFSVWTTFWKLVLIFSILLKMIWKSESSFQPFWLTKIIDRICYLNIVISLLNKFIQIGMQPVRVVWKVNYLPIT